ncbi:unnamed protein product [Fraxinus pennsylvanica]|uniref:Protein EXORDIUM-like n=1 Tax=Fraxinus pennsylvanica TaxID=56036 RepID=A0AAD1ZB69_9LAMI|nr:unnamed protein product [Fraxinus pennsylvanica]
MAASFSISVILISTFSFISFASSARILENQDPMLFKYHNGPLLTGKITVNLIWYGNFKPSQKAIISDFIASLSSSKSEAQPSVSRWWGATEKYYHLIKSKKSSSPQLVLGNQIFDDNCSLGKSLTTQQPIYGPQGPPLVAPNNDVGLDGMVINLASLLAGTATNPFGNGYYQGPSDAPLEAASACPGVYAKGAYPGYAGDLLVDPTTGASYNANGVNGRKYLVPALYDPTTKLCSTLV